jgi:hypothetical protein
MNGNEVPSKKFSLRQNETEKLKLVRAHLDAIFSIELSDLVADRFSYRITERTKFVLSEDYKTVQVWDAPGAINQSEPGAPNQPGGPAVI